jgi:hypothetical protein
MIQLNPDCLVFETPTGKHFPCTAEAAAFQLIGESAPDVDYDVVQNASAAVLHYFKHELHQESVSVGDFAQALQKVFRVLGVATPADPCSGASAMVESDLGRLAQETADGGELLFFAILRDEIRRNLRFAPGLVRFRGLRQCAMRLVGGLRWNRRCQDVSDQIVGHIRDCWKAEAQGRSCPMVIL